MNVSLYNALVAAHNVFAKNDQYKAEIRKHEDRISQLKRGYNYQPTFKAPETNWTFGNFYFFIFFFFPVAAIKVVAYLFKLKKAEAEFQRNVASKFDKAAYQQSVRDEIAREQQEIAALQAAIKENMRINADKYQFLPKWVQNCGTTATDFLLRCVKNEFSNTLADAVKRFEKDCDERARQAEADLQHMQDQLEEDRRHREHMDHLDKIKNEQQRIRESIDTANKIRSGQYHF